LESHIENGKIAWTAFYGDRVPRGPLANQKTLYSVASLTKTITADIILILRLASDGKRSLDESIAEYWIDPDVKDNAWNKRLTLVSAYLTKRAPQLAVPDEERAAISVATRNAIRILGRRV
jgi:CubicO group peptidase (beta-lactamase class C family)